jgi:hypothetical protein
MTSTKRGIAFYSLFALLLGSMVAFLPASRRSDTVRTALLVEPLMIPVGAARDHGLYPYTYIGLKVVPGDSLDLFLFWVPPPDDGSAAQGAVDSLVTAFYYGADSTSGAPSIEVRLREVPLLAIDRTWTQRVPLFKIVTGWSRISQVQSCAVIHRRWLAQDREVYGALFCSAEQYIERRAYDPTIRIYREDPNPMSFGPDWNTYPPVPRVPAADSISMYLPPGFGTIQLDVKLPRSL